VAFAPTAELQERVRAAVIDGTSPGEILLCEHDPVVTLGRSADPAHVLASNEALAAAGVAITRASRGGNVTYHGPGQLVAYPIVPLRRGVVAHVEAMAAAVIAVLAELGIEGRWSRDRPGVWVDSGDPTQAAAKVCAFGVHVRRRVAIHGLALNVTDEPLGSDGLAGFSSIIPCGIADANVTSIESLVPGGGATVEGLAARVAHALAGAFQLQIEPEGRGQPSIAVATLPSA
jgi:lipoyl(octanoyl) transferase